MQTAQADDFSGNFTSDEMACASCGNEIKGKLWVCEKIAFAFGKGDLIRRGAATRFSSIAQLFDAQQEVLMQSVTDAEA